MSDPPLAGLFQDRAHLRSDAILIKKAIRQGWPISAEVRDAIVARVEQLFGDPRLTTRERLRLTQLSVDLDRDNLDAAAMAVGAFGPRKALSPKAPQHKSKP